jgi:uncharacterized protein (TIGR03435 family)
MFIQILQAGAVALLLSGALAGQTTDESLRFEVASVKPSAPRTQAGGGRRGCFGGPGSRDPGIYSCTNATIAMMAVTAYGVKGYQLRPAASDFTDQFDINAKVPPGISAEQTRTMLRNLLSERFKLSFHREAAQIPAYALTVAKGGLKMKESTPPATEEGAPRPAPRPVTDADGFVYLPIPNGVSVARSGSLTRWVGTNCPSEVLIGYLNSALDRPAFDATGPAGRYDFVLTFRTGAPGDGAGPDDGGLTLFGALAKQLGLHLEPKKMATELFVIDHFEKVPEM